MNDYPIEMKPLTDWLSRHRARKLWKLESDRTTHFHRFVIEAYDVGGGIALVQRWQDGGWDLFVPSSLNPAIDTTLLGAERALDIS